MPYFSFRHLPFLLLMALLVFHCAQTFGVYLIGDDIGWLRRTVADAHQPWNIFGKPVFGNYYRPVINAVWLFNYIVWGFNFYGYQLTLVLIWLAGIVLLYSAGCRLGGRAAGLIAAGLVGLNNVHLMLPTWKSWFTALTEFAVVAAWFLCFVKWLEGRQRKHLIGWVVLAVVGTLAKESTPLIVSGGIFITLVWPLFRERRGVDGVGEDKSRSLRRALLAALLWAGLSAAVLLVLPSYRGAFKSVLGIGAVGQAAGVPKEFAWTYLARNFRSHTAGMFGRGIARHLLLVALLGSAWRLFRVREKMPRRYLRAFLGALIIGAITVSLPVGARVWGTASQAFAHLYVWPTVHALLLGAFMALALAGDRRDRLLAVWLAASMAPPLLFRLGSGAYHMPAFAALALYIGKQIAPFLKEEMPPVWERLRGRTQADSQDAPRLILAGLLALIIVHQAYLLFGNFRFVHLAKSPVRGVETLPMRVARGEANREAVQRAVNGVLADPAPDRRVWIAGDGLEWLAALELKGLHKFRVEELLKREGLWVGLRRFDTKVRVYGDAIPYDRRLFARFNLLLQAGFEEDAPGLLRPGGGRLGRSPLVVQARGTKLRRSTMEMPPFRLAPSAAVVFGGFMRREARRCGKATMTLRSKGGRRYEVSTAPLRQRRPRWEFVWECAAPEDVRERFVFRVIDVRNLVQGALYADHVFFCPVTSLVRQCRMQNDE